MKLSYYPDIWITVGYFYQYPNVHYNFGHDSKKCTIRHGQKKARNVNKFVPKTWEFENCHDKERSFQLWFRPCINQPTHIYLFIYFFVSLLLSSFWTSCGLRCRPFPPVRAFSFIAHKVQHSRCSSISSNVANSRFLAFRESICAQEKVPTNLYEYALGGTRTHEIDL